MADVVRRPLARQDLLDLWDYIADRDETAADGVLDRIEAVLAMLADNPEAGRLRAELFENLRSFPVGSFVLFYVPKQSGIELVRVLSGYRDIGRDDFET
ncbi:type II toxin-antitoxin system RelE/ParE family toxin [Methylobacterium sp. R2-1]|uniref:type II toxin-antitoxin system RelE/ParE family toxin n=1 Tax=Methylobacterium sp. R2-1 TaxID=2587064 RepID=UPI00160C5DE4|nr:type II toxin-antitoxin system RelE/ParE family toxin [Methylobacterium sp. R2-1]MBB2963905.1 toxin ParE1/3/4 [Methylobacterium sp. R2-1]